MCVCVHRIPAGSTQVRVHDPADQTNTAETPYAGPSPSAPLLTPQPTAKTKRRRASESSNRTLTNPMKLWRRGSWTPSLPSRPISTKGNCVAISANAFELSGSAASIAACARLWRDCGSRHSGVCPSPEPSWRMHPGNHPSTARPLASARTGAGSSWITPR